jgi:hypothetical protein
MLLKLIKKYLKTNVKSSNVNNKIFIILSRLNVLHLKRSDVHLLYLLFSSINFRICLLMLQIIFNLIDFYNYFK